MKINKRFTPILSDNDNAISISLPLCEKAYRQLYDDKADPILRDKELAFVVLTQSPNSSLVKQGLEGNELTIAAKRELGLAKNWKPSEHVLYAIQHYNATNGSAIVTYVKNLHKQYNNRNKSISIIANKIKLLQSRIDKLDELGDNNASVILDSINQLVDLEKALDTLSKSVPEQIRVFNAAITELEEELKQNVSIQGGGIIDDSMDPEKSIVNRAN